MDQMKLTKELEKALLALSLKSAENIDCNEFAEYMDASSDFDTLNKFRDEFYFPTINRNDGIRKKGEKVIYLCGHSLGLQPKTLSNEIQKELNKWSECGVEGHFLRGSEDTEPWVSYDESPLKYLAEIVGSKESEVVAMNSLTANLQFLMQSFYKPTKERYKILVEDHLFPSDFIACKTQLENHGFDVESGLIKVKPRDGELSFRTEDILKKIKENESSLALVLLGGVQYLSGQFFELDKIGAALSTSEVIFGVDLAHAVGNVPLKLHEWGVDFACWCSYKYLNTGPGGIGGAFIHEKHIGTLDKVSSRKGFLGGWWSHQLKDRFEMKHELIPSKSALAWQVSNPPIVLLACLNASLKQFHEAGMENLRRRSISLTRYLEILLELKFSDYIEVVTPCFERFNERGSMLCLRFKKEKDIDSMYKKLEHEGIIGDVRRPDIMRIAPCAMYNSFQDVLDFTKVLGKVVGV